MEHANDTPERSESDTVLEREVSAVFEVLAHAERRRVLRSLRESEGGTVPVDDLARNADPSRDPENVRATLHHCHLPKLADAGFVEYDERTVEIRRERKGYHDAIRRVRAACARET